MVKKEIYHSLLPWIGVGLVAMSLACAKNWSVRGSSFPQEMSADRGVSESEEKQKGESPTPSPLPQASREGDQISGRAEALRREAEKLAQEATGLEKGEKNQEQGESPSSGGQKWESEAEPERSPGTPGAFQAVEALQDVFFEFDQFLLSEGARRILEKNAEWLRSHPQAQVLIEGHCDERGTVEYNLALGERRAQSAKDYLMNLGVSKDRLSVISYGKEKPFALGHEEEAWVQNRRAHFLLRFP